jgi:hypothetical protein
MKQWCVALVCTVFVCPSAAEANPHVRTLDPAVARAYEAGYRESPTFRALVAALQDTDVIVTWSATSPCPAASAA